MALFGKKKTAKKADAVAVAQAPAGSNVNVAGLSHVLQNPRITEKATMHQNISVYTFDIAKVATKRDVLKAVQALYKVTPRMVHVVNIPSKIKRNMRTGKSGVKGGGKKAYVYLKSGETITIS